MKHELKITAIVVAIAWGIFLIDGLLGLGLNRFGVLPRSLGGLWGIITMPFLHGGLFHILGNTIPFVIMSVLFMLFYRKHFGAILLELTIFTGILTWIIGGGNAVHVGASGVIFAMFGFLVASGIVRKNMVHAGVSILVTLIYGIQIFIGLLPVREGISYSGHWSGLIVGGVLAYVYHQFDKEKDTHS